MDGELDRYEPLAKEIRKLLKEGTDELEKNPHKRAELNFLVKEAGLYERPESFDSWTIMKELTWAILRDWPDAFQLTTFDSIFAHVSPLRKIREALKPDEVNQWVKIVEEPRIIDPRLPLSKFREELRKAILEVRV